MERDFTFCYDIKNKEVRKLVQKLKTENIQQLRFVSIRSDTKINYLVSNLNNTKTINTLRFHGIENYNLVQIINHLPNLKILHLYVRDKTIFNEIVDRLTNDNNYKIEELKIVFYSECYLPNFTGLISLLRKLGVKKLTLSHFDDTTIYKLFDELRINFNLYYSNLEVLNLNNIYATTPLMINIQPYSCIDYKLNELACDEKLNESFINLLKLEQFKIKQLILVHSFHWLPLDMFSVLQTKQSIKKLKIYHSDFEQSKYTRNLFLNFIRNNKTLTELTIGSSFDEKELGQALLDNRSIIKLNNEYL